MNNNTRILLKFGLWALTGFILVLIGVSRVNALTTTTIYANANRTQSNKYLYSLLTEGGTENVQIGNIGTNYTGRAIGISFWYNDNIVLNKTYKVRINFYLDDLVPSFNSSMVEINTCSGDTCNPTNLVGISKQNNSGYSTWVQFEYTPQMVGNYVRVDIGNNKRDYITGTTYFGINSVQIESVNQNEDIMNNANQNANNIINNNNSNTQNIIDNDTSNTQAIIDSNKETFNNCYKNLINSRQILENGGRIVFNGNSSNTSYQFPAGNYTFIYKGNGELGTYYRDSNSTGNVLLGNSKTISITATQDFNLWLYRSSTSSVSLSNFSDFTLVDSEYGEILSFGEEKCVNVIKEQEKTSKGILAKIKELISGLFDTSGPDTDSLNGMAGWLPPGPVDSILNLPLTFLNNLTISVSSSCSPVSLPLPFVDKSFDLPCFNSIINSINGANNLWILIGTITSVLILYYYLKNLYKWIDNKLSMNEDTDWGGI